MTIICPKCEIEFRPKKLGVVVETMMVDGPYQLYIADVLECPGCEAEVVAGLGEPMAEHFQAGYEQIATLYRPTVRAWKNQNEKAAFNRETQPKE
jgi:hypothetical protein